MTGSLTKRKSSKNYYIQLKYKDPLTLAWKSKTISTNIEVKNNKRAAKALIDEAIEKYSFLEELPNEYNIDVDKDILFCDYLDMWLAYRRTTGIREASYESDVCRVNSIKAYYSRLNLKLSDINTIMLNKFFDYSLLSGKQNQRTKEREKPLSVRTVRDYRNTLNMVFKRAIREGYLSHNPVGDTTIEGKRNREYMEEKLFLTEEDMKSFFHFLYNHERYHFLFPMAYMGIYYGLRRSELLGLKYSAIDFRNNTLSIQHTITKVKSIHAEDNTKTKAGRRILRLSDDFKMILEEIRQKQISNKNFFKEAYQNTENYIFTWDDGRIYDPDYISKIFKKAFIDFGRPELSLHKLRHTCASLLINSGCDILSTQYWLGHKDKQTTLNIYSHFDRNRLDKVENHLTAVSSVLTTLSS